jgi:hypothetical protein
LQGRRCRSHRPLAGFTIRCRYVAYREKSSCAPTATHLAHLQQRHELGKRHVRADIDARWPIEYIRDLGDDRSDRGAGTGVAQASAAEGCRPWFLPQRVSPSISIP